MLRTIALVPSAFLVLVAMSSSAHAAADVWDGNGAVPPSNNWNFDPSWADNSAPGNADTATFNIGAIYTVSFSVTNPDAIQALTISAGDVTFASTSSTARNLRVNSASGSQDVSITGASTFLTLGAAASNDVNLIAGDDLSIQNDASLTAHFGSDVTAADLSAAGLNGSIVMDGPGSTLTLTGAGTNNFIGRSGNDGYLFLVGGTTGNSIAGNLGLADSGTNNSTGLVAITAGSTLSLAGNLTLANQDHAGQVASLDIYDAGSSLTQTGATTITVGALTEGTADINIGVAGDGGTLSTGTGLFRINATGTVTIGNSSNNNDGTLNANGDVLVDGGVLRRNRGNFIVAPTQTMTVQNGGRFDVRGFYNADANFVVTGSGSLWTSNSSISIGALAAGSLTISSGGDVTNTASVIGVAAGSDGDVTVTGSGSTWTNSSALNVGSSGTGALTISAGGDVFNTDGGIGATASGEGTVTVTGAGSMWTNSGELTVGSQGTGTLNIQLGGDVTSSSGVVGRDDGSDGTVTVSGAGSTWTSTLTVGHQGNGTLNIENGGVVSGPASVIGNASGGDGVATVTGLGSAWNNSGEFFVGNLPGTTGTLTIADGGSVSNADGLLGVSPGHDVVPGAIGTVVVTGAGSTWTNSDELYVGISGTGDLSIEAGGEVTSTTAYIAHDADGTGSVTVMGAGSTWNTSSLNVGGSLSAAGGNGELTISTSGLVEVSGNTNVWTAGALDIQAGGNFNANGDVMVDGGLLTRASTGTFDLDPGNTLNIENGGVASFTGSYTTATNATYNVSGTGSTLETPTGGLSINNAAEVNVSSGGHLESAGNLVIGNAGNGTLSVDGSGSSLDSAGPSTFWGRLGNSATVTFSNDAVATLTGGLNLAASSNANTSAVLDVLSNADFNVGALALAVSGGASTSATLNVQGSGSSVTQTGAVSLTIGHFATGTAAINVGTTVSGGRFTTGTGLTAIHATGVVSIGNGANIGAFNANGNVTITGGLLQRGAGSDFNLADGKTMTVQSSGEARFTGGYTTANNAIYNVSAALLETVTGSLVIRNGAQLNVEHGGTVASASFLDIAVTGGNGTLTVDGVGSSATGAAPGLHSWALNGRTADVTFRNSATGSFLGGINLAGSATAGTTATVDVVSDADLTIGPLVMAALGGATTSATLTVDGAGSSLMQIGGSATTIGHSATGSASLLVQNNSSFTSGTGVILVEDTGTIELNSGAVFDALGTIELSGGSFNFLGGTLHVDQFIGDLVNQGGTLAPGHSPGSTTLHGDYTQLAAATLEIELGGTTMGTQYDTLDIGGATTLAGTLEVLLVNSFVPSLGNAFQILTYGGAVNGVFDSVILPALADLAWDTSTLYTTGEIRVADASLPGDFNGDGSVDAADYVIWRKGLGTIYTQDDYDDWRANFGGLAPGAGASAGAQATKTGVPEPASCILLLILAAGLAEGAGRRSARGNVRR
jgi:T5SS/PEP-CTERM-associated repeat protein